MLQFAVYTAPGGTLIEDYSARIQQAIFATNGRGFAEASGFVPMRIDEAFRLYDRGGLPHVVFSDSAAGPIYEGRLEDVNITGDGVELHAFGYQRALQDSTYTALWSMSDVTQFRPILTSEVAGYTPELYKFDTSNRISITLPQGSIYGNAANIGSMIFQKPEGGSRQIIGVMFDAVCALPNNWVFRYVAWSSGFGVAGTAAIFTSGGAITVLNKFISVAACDYLSFEVFNNTGANYLVNNAPNVWSLNITNVRLVTATTNKVDTTMTVAQLAGVNITCTVGSTARMYVGQRLHIGLAAAAGEGVIVKQILSATQFVADFTAPFAIGTPVQAFVIYADEIAKDMRAAISTLNGAQLAASDVLIQSPALDLLNESYEDQYPADILDRLITLGDNQTPPRQWEWGVQAGRLLSFRPQSSAARTWYIDVSDLEVQRSLDDMANSVYATYQEAGGQTLRTAVATDTTSVTRYGLTRRRQIDVDTTSTTQATAQRDAALSDSKDPKPRSGVTIRAVYDGNGTRWPLWAPQSGDTMVIRNLPPTLSAALDRIRIFRLTRTEYHAEDDTLTIEPESPLPSLDAMLALAVPPAWVTVPWWVQIRQK